MKNEEAGVFRETISRDEVTASTRNLKPGKSAGRDKIISEMLRHTHESVIDLFFFFFCPAF